MKNSVINYLLVLVLFAGLVSCEKKDDETTPQDVTRPEITDVHFHGAPGGRTTAGATNFRVHFTVRDNVALREVKIDIHDRFDGHTHRISRGTAFSWDTIIQVTGTQFNERVPVMIPANVLAGPYHVGVFVTDAAGNQGDSRWTALEIGNSSQPIFNNLIIAGLAVPQAEFEMEPGDTLRIGGTATDSDGLEEVHIKIEEEEHDHGHGGGRISDGMLMYEREFKPSTHPALFSNGNNTFDFASISDSDAARMSGVSAGQHKDFKLEIKAKDNLGNIIKREFKLHVH